MLWSEGPVGKRERLQILLRVRVEITDASRSAWGQKDLASRRVLEGEERERWGKW